MGFVYVSRQETKMEVNTNFADKPTLIVMFRLKIVLSLYEWTIYRVFGLSIKLVVHHFLARHYFCLVCAME
jgi:hypothetical protein